MEKGTKNDAVKEKIEKLYVQVNKDYADVHKIRNPIGVVRHYQGRRNAVAEVLSFVNKNPTITRDEIFKYIARRASTIKNRPIYQSEHQSMDNGYLSGYIFVVRHLVPHQRRQQNDEHLGTYIRCK